MTDRIPLIVNSTASQIQELPNNDSLQLNDTNQIKLGSDDDFSVFHDGSNGSLNLATGSLTVRVTDTIGKGFYIEDPNGGSAETIAKFEKDSTSGKGRCELMFEGTKKFETTSAGGTVTGATILGGTLTVQSTTDSTSKDTGAVIIEGGVGIEKNVYVGGDITAFDTSDVTLKENITPISNAVDKVLSISGNTFRWNDKSIYNGEEGTGIIAQEIEALGLPGVTTIRENGTKAVRYDRLVPLLIEAIKELNSKIESLGG